MNNSQNKRHISVKGTGAGTRAGSSAGPRTDRPRRPVDKAALEKKKKRRMMLNILYTPLMFAFLSVYMEIFFHVFTYDNFRIVYPVLLSLPTALLFGALTDLFPDKAARILRWVYALVHYLIYGTQIVYFHVFKDLMSWSMIGMAGDVAKGFMKDTLLGIWESVPKLLVMAVPLLVLGLTMKFWKVRNIVNLPKTLLVLGAFVVFQVVALIALPIGGTRPHTAYDLYHNKWDLSLSGEKLGMTCSTWMDWKLSVFGDPGDDPGTYIPVVTLPPETTAPSTTSPDDPPQSTGPDDPPATSTEPSDPPIDQNPFHTIEGLDFAALAAAETDPTRKSIFTYLSAVEPTRKNEYTGLFSGYNLVMICAESFSTQCISEEYTPTLYRLANSGFVFNNYWSSYPSVTTNGEYSFLTGLYPDLSKPKADGSFLFSVTNHNTMNMTIASWFKAQGVTPMAYHPNTGTYYSRNKTHPNLGYVFKAQEDYKNLTGWPESDLVMIQDSLEDYIHNDRFCVYMMSVSGHHNYKFGGYNDIADKNRALVEDADLSKLGMNFDLSDPQQAEMAEHAKAYIACHIELDRALGYLIEQLEKEGTLDKTVFCVAADHYPYGFDDDEFCHLMGYSRPGQMKYDRLERYKSTLILWNSAMGTVEVNKPCCTVDILPTLLNLFGFEYDSRLYSGQDILSDSYGLAMLKNQSFITDKIVYSSSYDSVFRLDSSWKMPEGYLDAYIQMVSNRFTIAEKILNSDFYAALPADIVAAAQASVYDP